MPEEKPLIQLSALQHYSYCPRQCALIHQEQSFDENLFTLRGRRVHERVDAGETTTEDGVRVERTLPLLTRDDEKQYQKALRLFNKNQIFIPITVVLELEWVLRFAYQFKPIEIAGAFEKLAGLDQVTIDRPEQLSLALQGLRNNMDFADALHLTIAATTTSQFVTFDKKLARNAVSTDRQIKLLN